MLLCGFVLQATGLCVFVLFCVFILLSSLEYLVNVLLLSPAAPSHLLCISIVHPLCSLRLLQPISSLPTHLISSVYLYTSAVDLAVCCILFVI